MEVTDDVLVVIQAESGEEIALPLAALDEQHQEVIVDGSACTSRDVIREQNDTFKNIPELDPNFRGEQVEKAETVKVFRPKQKRKQDLIFLPLSEDDMKLEFQIIDDSPSQMNEDSKKRPRREYRTRKKLAALEAANNDNESTVPSPTPEAEDDCDNNKAPSPVVIKKEDDSKLDPENRAEQASPRRTRLSNACRVATSKMYKCTECDFTTERINNIVMHMKESCHKMGK